MCSVFRDTPSYVGFLLPTTTSCARYSVTLLLILCLFYQQQLHVLGIQGHSYLYCISFTNNNFMCSVFSDTPIDIMSFLPTTTSCARYSGTLLFILCLFYQQQLHVLGIQGHSWLYCVSFTHRAVTVENCHSTTIVLGVVKMAINVIGCENCTFVTICGRISFRFALLSDFHVNYKK